MLNEEQSDGFDQIFDHVVCGRGHVFFVDGLEALVRSMDLIAIATTTSSIATSIMPGGRTAHSRFKIPIELGDNCVCNFTKQNFLLRIGNGTEETYINDYVLLPEDIVIEYSSDKSLDKFIECVFPNLKENYTSPSYMREHAILSTRNEHVDGLNARMIDMFPGKEKVYFSHDSVDDDTNNNYPLYFLNSITPNGLPLHELKVKKNCPVILNLDPHNGLCNGTRLVVRSFEDNTIDAEIVNGQHDGNRVFISRIPLYLSEDITLPFKFKRKQFPVRLSFAMTINKSQG
uniref:ATP-dependent DNA helicase n=1 Tax=Setaria italica TaxID=4555 RepID=K3YMN4_SETIT